MKDFIKSVMSLGITAGLSDRESFVKEVSSIIQNYQDDPEKAEKWAAMLIAYLEKKRDDIHLEQVIKNMAAKGNFSNKEEKMDELIAAVQELTKEIQNLKHKE